ncbi:hypothetical protein [Robertmurraya andreesenii]|uniref:Uncharacterized protein n=1 Tax=Anoxybacillus andreesenii TaxID=1325932 RepID=A0ABT9V808_9BACL|nr:hypothetical protein [Robertmurraya andreesenii]MDQ0157089.1 hypothetical protein [Robertmurraya andreesenii]
MEDFVNNSVIEDNSIGVTAEPPPLTVARNYITNPEAKLNVTGKINWGNPTTYVRGGMNVYAYNTTHTEYGIKAAKKFQFNAGTAVSVIIGAIVSWVASPGIVIAMLTSLGAVLVDNTLKYVWSPTLKVDRISNIKGIICGGGMTIVTKNWSDYIVNNDNGKKERYTTDQYNAWYNNWSLSKLADVGYQQYRYIVGLRNTTPKASEFN